MMPERSNIVLIGMPGSGKTTLGQRLAGLLTMQFVDTDKIIEQRVGYSLQQLVNQRGHRFMRVIEEQTLTSLTLENHVIATGGSAVYSTAAMQHLARSGSIVYLHISLPILLQRVTNSASRGLVKLPRISLPHLYRERLPLYRQWAEVTVENNHPLTAWQFDKFVKQLAAADL